MPVALIIICFLGLFLLAMSLTEHIDSPQSSPEPRSLGMDGKLAQAASTDEPLLTVDNLAAFYRTSRRGSTRDVRAVDHLSLTVKRNEIYGIAGDSPGKTRNQGAGRSGQAASADRRRSGRLPVPRRHRARSGNRAAQ